MPAAARKKQSDVDDAIARARAADKSENEYIRETLAFLAKDADREAVRLISRHGVLAVSDPTAIDAAVERLWHGRAEFHKKERTAVEELDRAQAAARQAMTEPAAIRALHDLERAYIRCNDLLEEKVLEIAEPAYLLGIAVGRRLGAAAFGGVR